MLHYIFAWVVTMPLVDCVVAFTHVRQPFCMYFATEGINFCNFLEMTTQPAICNLARLSISGN